MIGGPYWIIHEVPQCQGAENMRQVEIYNCFITVRITFTSILYPQCIHMIYIIYTSYSLHITGIN